ncbi:hypothetical protein G6011_08092 [Alternaria panax]|uniref:Uncharacterized protein n=1 Tax=Alternaria panax TaxID=48097 RepID=A0AAD4I9W6_9PLEO|nr:hypothetical protein G6011_08092 [Alternaria panax]
MRCDFGIVDHDGSREQIRRLEMREEHNGDDAVESRHGRTPESTLTKYNTEHDKSERKARHTCGAATTGEDYIRKIWEGVPSETDLHESGLHKLRHDGWVVSTEQFTSRSQPTRLSDSTCIPKFPAPIRQETTQSMASV